MYFFRKISPYSSQNFLTNYVRPVRAWSTLFACEYIPLSKRYRAGWEGGAFGRLTMSALTNLTGNGWQPCTLRFFVFQIQKRLRNFIGRGSMTKLIIAHSQRINKWIILGPILLERSLTIELRNNLHRSSSQGIGNTECNHTNALIEPLG